MKKLIYLFIYCLLLLVAKANAQNCDCLENTGSPNWINQKCEDFNAYDWTQQLSIQSSKWIKWGRNSGDADVIFTSHSTTGIYAEFTSKANHANPDLLFPLNNRSSGKYRLSWKMKILSGKKAYYNIQHNENVTSGGHWAFSISIDENGNADLESYENSSNIKFKFRQNDWVDVVQVIDISNDLIELWIDHQFVHSWPFSNGNKGSRFQPSSILGAINFYAGKNHSYAINNICLTYIDPTFFITCIDDYIPVCINNRIYQNACYAGVDGYSALEWQEGSCNSNACECETNIYGDLILCDGFESYNNGAITVQSNNWHKYLTPSRDANVTRNNSYSGSKILTFKNTSSRSGSKVVLKLGNKRTGKYRLEWMEYVPTNKVAKHGLLFQYANNGHHDWAYRCHFNSNSKGEILAGINQKIKTFDYPQNKWFRVVQLVDLDNDEIEVWIDNQFIHKWTYSDGKPVNALQLGSLVCWADQANYEWSMDALCYREINCQFIDCDISYKEEVCVNGQEFINPCMASCEGYSEYEWTEGKCNSNPPRKCNDCTTCFSYWLTNDNIVNFTNNYCNDNVQINNQGTESVVTYNWDFPNGSVLSYENGTNKNSYEPVCKFNPGLWKVCLLITIPSGEVPITYSCCVYINVPRSVCNKRPPTCGLKYYKNPNGTFTFDASSTIDADHYSWSVDGSYGSISSALDLDQNKVIYNCEGWGNDCYTICVTATNCYGYSRFCVEVCIDNDDCPTTLPYPVDVINYTISGDELSFQNVPAGWDSYEWSVPDNFIFRSGDKTSRTWRCGIPEYGRYEICLTMRYGCSQVCYCWTVGYGPIRNDIQLYFEDEVCGSVGQVIELPLRVKNFNNVGAIDAEISIENTSIAEIIAAKGSVLLNTPVQWNIDNRTLVLQWNPLSGNEVSLPDGSIIAIIKVKLIGDAGQSTKLLIRNSELEVNGSPLIPHTIDGSVCINNSSSICGQIYREDKLGIAQVLVGLTGNGISRAVETDNDGRYCFEDLPSGGRYKITPYKNINVLNGVRSSDAAAVQRHILRKKLITSPYKMIAADANNNRSIKSSDPAKIQQIILRKIKEFPNNKSWRFIPENYIFPNPSNPFQSIFPESKWVNDLNNPITGLNFIGVKVGDINLTNNPSNINEPKSNLKTRGSGSIYLSIDKIEASEKEEVSVKLTAEQLAKVLSMQFSLQWDPDMIDLVNVETNSSILKISKGNFNLDSIDIGQLMFAWFDADGNGINTQDTSTILELIFKVVGTKGSYSDILFTNYPIEIDAEDINENSLTVTTSNGRISITTLSAFFDVSDNEFIQLFPNPASDVIKVFLTNWNNGANYGRIYDQYGKIVKKINPYRSKYLEINISDLPNGIYYIQLSSKESNYLKNIVITHDY